MAQSIYAAGIIIENQSGEILVLQRHPESIEGGMWCLPGGKLEKDEDALTAAVRELAEETGIIIDQKELVRVHELDVHRDDKVLPFVTFKLKTAERLSVSNLAAHEHTAYKWLQPAELMVQKDLMTGLYPILKDLYAS